MHHGKTEERIRCRSIVTRNAATDLDWGGTELRKRTSPLQQTRRTKRFDITVQVVSKHTMNQISFGCHFSDEIWDEIWWDFVFLRAYGNLHWLADFFQYIVMSIPRTRRHYFIQKGKHFESNTVTVNFCATLQNDLRFQSMCQTLKAVSEKTVWIECQREAKINAIFSYNASSCLTALMANKEARISLKRRGYDLHFDRLYLLLVLIAGSWLTSWLWCHFWHALPDEEKVEKQLDEQSVIKKTK